LPAGASLADVPRMTKILATAFALFVCGPALADAPPASAASDPLQLDLKLDVGKDSRHYSLKLVDNECGNASSKAGQVEDNIKICARADGTKVQLHVNWWTREGDHEMRNDSTTVVARGTSFVLVGDSAMLRVALQ
jgi:hypothetical protein